MVLGREKDKGNDLERVTEQNRLETKQKRRDIQERGAHGGRNEHGADFSKQWETQEPNQSIPHNPEMHLCVPFVATCSLVGFSALLQMMFCGESVLPSCDTKGPLLSPIQVPLVPIGKYSQ